MRDLQADREGGVSGHAWQSILQIAGSSPGSTDSVEQCRSCSVVRHTYSYSTLERQMSTVRTFFLGDSVVVDDECKGLLRMLPVASEVENTVEPIL